MHPAWGGGRPRRRCCTRRSGGPPRTPRLRRRSTPPSPTQHQEDQSSRNRQRLVVLTHRLRVGYELRVARARREGCRAARGGGVDCVLHADHREEVAAGRLHREEYLHTPEPTTVVQSRGCLRVAGTYVRAGDAAGGGEAGDARRGRLVAAGFVDQLRVHGELRVGAARKRLAVWLRRRRWWW